MKIERGMLREIFQARRRMGGAEGLCHGRPRIPGTDFLANVTPKQVRPYAFAMLFRNRTAQLDGQIGDTLPRVECPGISLGNNGLRRTRIDAAGTGTTPVRRG